MSTVNIGNQNITFDYKQLARAEEFNKLNRDLIEPGVYRHPVITFTNSPAPTIEMSPFTIAINSDASPFSPTNKVIRVETSAPTSVAVAPYGLGTGTYFFYAVFTWFNAEEVWLEYSFRSTSPNIPVPNEIIFGTVVIDSGQVTSFTTAGRTRGLNKLYVGEMKDTLSNKNINDTSVIQITNEIIEGVVTGTKQGWSATYQDFDSVYTNLPKYKIITRIGTQQRIRMTFGYGATATPAEGKIAQILYEWSENNGSTYSTLYTENINYDDNIERYGNIVSGINSLNTPELASRALISIGHLPNLVTTEKKDVVRAINWLKGYTDLRALAGGDTNIVFNAAQYFYKYHNNGASANVDWNNGSVIRVSHSSGDPAKTFLFSNFLPTASYTLLFDVDFYGNNITLPAGIKWHEDSAYFADAPQFQPGLYIINFLVYPSTPNPIIAGSIYGIFE